MQGKKREKRLFPRIPLRTPVSFRIRGTPQHKASLSKDISAGGMSLNTNQFLVPDTLLSLEFSVLQRFFTLYAKTKWISHVPISDNYKFGLEFLEVHPEDKKFLSDYIMLRGHPV